MGWNWKLIVSLVLISVTVGVVYYKFPDFFNENKTIILSMSGGAAFMSFILLHLLGGKREKVTAQQQPLSQASRSDASSPLRGGGALSDGDSGLLQTF